MNEPAPFPWEAALAFGLGHLRWSPDTFWRATPRELAAAAAGLSGLALGPAPANADDLARLMRAFPDERG